ncbi:MAG: Minf_1886 family protein [Verrucomicrobiota bacterium]
MHEATFEEGIELILIKDQRYDRDAYVFVREALDHTQKAIIKENRGQLRHVSGQELLGGIRDYALEQFGPMAITVLEEWGIRECADFGEIVFNMVEASVLAKTEEDSREDFQGGYNFEEAFRDPFLPAAKRLKSKTVSPAASDQKT